MSGAAPALAARKQQRKDRNRAFRRGHFLAAAKRVFAAKGLDGASVRDIAREAGYSPAAIYFYYPSKEAIYGDILADSLAALIRSIKEASPPSQSAADRMARAALAFYDYYFSHRDELDLSFYLFNGIRPRGLTPEINRQLNGRLIALLQYIADLIAAATDLPRDSANEEAVAAFSHMSGLLLLNNSGRLKTFGFDGRTLAERYVRKMTPRPLT
ncbi:MAG: TetR/AcrR family transcriptional regulator [Alphaproteobacteria bacterium]